jgi:hypothetical protein
MNKPIKQSPALFVGPWEYVIIQTARDAQRRLQERNLSPQEVRAYLNLLRLGQDLVMRLQGCGVQLPQIDLSYSPSSTAASPSHVENGQPAGVCV